MAEGAGGGAPRFLPPGFPQPRSCRRDPESLSSPAQPSPGRRGVSEPGWLWQGPEPPLPPRLPPPVHVGRAERKSRQPMPKPGEAGNLAARQEPGLGGRLLPAPACGARSARLISCWTATRRGEGERRGGGRGGGETQRRPPSPSGSGGVVKLQPCPAPGSRLRKSRFFFVSASSATRLPRHLHPPSGHRRQIPRALALAASGETASEGRKGRQRG